MDQSVFDAASFVAFNLEKGIINSRCKDGLALVPLDVLAALEPNDKLTRIARDFGKCYGADLKEKIEDGRFGLGFEVLSRHLTGTMATLGLGRVSLEIHGNALLFRLLSHEVSDGYNAIVGGFLGGYLEAVTQNPFEAIVLQEKGDEGCQLLWAGNPSAASTLKHSLEGGLEPLVAIDKLAERSAS